MGIDRDTSKVDEKIFNGIGWLRRPDVYKQKITPIQESELEALDEYPLEQTIFCNKFISSKEIKDESDKSRSSSNFTYRSSLLGFANSAAVLLSEKKIIEQP